MIELAKEMKNLAVFTHVSTAYVNCNQPNGEIKEVIYDMDLDVEERVSELMKMTNEYVKENESKLISDYPNTYAYTKSLTEKMLFKRRGNLKMVICRPSIVGAALREPCKGWIDSLAAAGGLSILVAVGLVNYLPCARPENHFDIVPVDMVSNGILITSAYADKADSKTGCLHIYNQGTSQVNPITMAEYKDNLLIFNKYFTFHKRVFPPYLELNRSELEYKIKTKLFNDLPIEIYHATSGMPFIGNKALHA